MSPLVLTLACLLLLGLFAPTYQAVGAVCRNNSDCARKECCRNDVSYSVVTGGRALRSVIDFSFTEGTCMRRASIGNRCYKEWGSMKVFTGDTSPIYPSTCPCASSHCAPVNLPATQLGQPGICSFFKR